MGASKWAKQDRDKGEASTNGKGDGGDQDTGASSASGAADLKKRENELREKMLRQKVMKTRRKSSAGAEDNSTATRAASDDS